MSRIQETDALLEKLDKEVKMIRASSRDTQDMRNDMLENIYLVLGDIARSLAFIADK